MVQTFIKRSPSAQNKDSHQKDRRRGCASLSSLYPGQRRVYFCSRGQIGLRLRACAAVLDPIDRVGGTTLAGYQLLVGCTIQSIHGLWLDHRKTKSNWKILSGREITILIPFLSRVDYPWRIWSTTEYYLMHSVFCPTSSVRLQLTKEGHFLTKFDGTGMK
jgi:hypothetical protein